jgi:PAS domain-containing protein
MSDLATKSSIDKFEISLLRLVQENADRQGVNVRDSNPGDALSSLMKLTAKKYEVNAVVLIDEYDKPILDHLNNPQKAEEIRDVMRNFYARIKSADASLRFVFFTGITKFSKMGVFSALNNLIDISMNDRYAQMLGYTEDELLLNFDAYIDKTANQLEMPKETLITEIRAYYDGFSFDGKTKLYNPFSTLNFFFDPKFKNYWFESGSPSFLIEYIKRHNLEVETFRGKKVLDNFASVSEIERATPESFLYQSGYLSVREKDDRELILDYPNMEVLSSVAELFLYGKYKVPVSKITSFDMEKAASTGDAEGIVRIYNTLLASLPYDVYDSEGRNTQSFYQAILYASLWSSRINTIAENHSYFGRSDIEAEINGHHYVIEMKVAKGKEESDRAVDVAMNQIHEKGYADKYAIPGANLIALVIDSENRCVGGWKIEKKSNHKTNAINTGIRE